MQHKFSRQREAILNNLKLRTDHPTADMVYADVRKIYPNISLGTVYRNLTTLASEKVIQMISTAQGLKRFDFTATPHCHFVCTHCNCVEDIPKGISQEILENAVETLCYPIEGCDVTFYGKCESCNSK